MNMCAHSENAKAACSVETGFIVHNDSLSHSKVVMACTTSTATPSPRAALQWSFTDPEPAVSGSKRAKASSPSDAVRVNVDAADKRPDIALRMKSVPADFVCNHMDRKRSDYIDFEYDGMFGVFFSFYTFIYVHYRMQDLSIWSTECTVKVWGILFNDSGIPAMTIL